MNNKIKAVIFDMDGVLIEAKEWHYDALNMALAHFGYTINRHEHLTSYNGLPTKKKLEMLSLEKGLPLKLHGFINKLKQKYTMDIIYTQCRPIFQHQYALSQLKQNGYKVVVASNSIRQTITTMMEKADLASFLDFYLSNEDVKHAKPHPEIYITAINQLNLQPSECVIVEDSEHGINAAIASGAYVMKVSGTEDVSLANITNFIKGLNND